MKTAMSELYTTERLESVSAYNGTVTVEGHEHHVVARTHDLYNLIATALTAVNQSQDVRVTHRVQRTVEAWLKRQLLNCVPGVALQHGATKINDLTREIVQLKTADEK